MEVHLSTGLFWLILIGLIAAVIYIWSSFAVLKKTNKEFEKSKSETDLRFSQQELAFQKVENDLKLNVNSLAQEQFERFKLVELDSYKTVIKNATLQECLVLLERWKVEEGDKLRSDAVVRSVGVNLGKITEHLLPFSSHLEQFDPRDIRFIGSPVDLMIFEGATAKNDIINIHLVEIKTGGSQLSKKQKAIRNAIASNRVHWLPITVPKFKWDIIDADEEEDDVPS